MKILFVVSTAMDVSTGSEPNISKNADDILNSLPNVLKFSLSFTTSKFVIEKLFLLKSTAVTFCANSPFCIPCIVLFIDIAVILFIFL